MSLYQQVHLEQSQAARLLLQNLVRWINDENGHFFDPELRTIYSLKLKEMFDEFLQEIAQLGGQVIFASPYKVIITTKKSSYYSAMNFINYLIKSLQKESKFQYIGMEVSQVFKCLIFKDFNNFQGVSIDTEKIDNKID